MQALSALEGEEDDDEEDIISSDIYSLTAAIDGTVHCVTLWYRVYLAEGSRRGRGALVDTGPSDAPLDEGGVGAVDTDMKMDRDEMDVDRGDDSDASVRPPCPVHWRQVGFLLDTPRAVRLGETVAVRVVVSRAVGVWCQVLPYPSCS